MPSNPVNVETAETSAPVTTVGRAELPPNAVLGITPEPENPRTRPATAVVISCRSSAYQKV
jgi:hypothetical protein